MNSRPHWRQLETARSPCGPKDAQALLTRATVRCAYWSHFTTKPALRLRADCLPACGTAVSGTLHSRPARLERQLQPAYSSLTEISTQGWLNSKNLAVFQTLGEMAVRLGRDGEAEKWFQQDLRLSPTDFYVACGLCGSDVAARAPPRRKCARASTWPGEFRTAAAANRHRVTAAARPTLHQPKQPLGCARRFAAELQRGEAVHLALRGKPRFLLEEFWTNPD